MQAKLLKKFHVSNANGTTTSYRLLSAGKRSASYVDYYLLQEEKPGTLPGEVHWDTVVDVDADRQTSLNDALFLLCKLLASQGDVEVYEP